MCSPRRPRPALQELELEALEREAAWEVQKETLRVESTELRSRCRLLQSESSLAQVFDKYEQEVAALQQANDRLRKENDQLHKKNARLEVVAEASALPASTVDRLIHQAQGACLSSGSPW